MSTTDFLTLHIALATYPKGKSKKYVESIESYYKKFRGNTKDYYTNEEEIKEEQLLGLYEPLTYHLFGNFDVAFITLIDNYKFTQKIFFPEDNDLAEDSGVGIETNSYQVLTGIFPQNDIDEIRGNLLQYGKKKFVSITNLKLSNGFLVGNGLDYLNKAISIVRGKLLKRGVDHIFLQSFSWFEITVVIFLDDISNIGDIVGDIRDISLRELDKEEAVKIIDDSFYTTFWPQEALLDFHLFADSQSYLGVKFSEYASPGKEKEFRKIELKTQIEWQVKPGQLKNLVDELRTLKVSRVQKSKQPIYALSGKSDYWIKEADGTLEQNYLLFQHSMLATSNVATSSTNSGSSIREHIRNYKTRLLIDFDITKKEMSPKLNGAFINPISTRLYFNSEDIRITYGQLKSLKISRHIRQKINKIFFNYNTGIQDPILSVYFYDFYNFLHHLRNVINVEYNLFRKVFIDATYLIYKPLKSVHEIEKILEEFIQTFEEGYHIRTLNCYQFEEIYDFDLDLNSSIQQLLTTYNTIVMDIADQFYAKKAYSVQFGPDIIKNERVYGHQQLVQLNLRNTVSTRIGINYNVYHLTTPEFIFFTLGKEIFNSIAKADELEIDGDESTKNTLPSLIASLNDCLEVNKNEYVSDLKKEGLLVPQSYIIDAIQLIFICNSDLRMYEYWFWMYNFQHTSMYSTKGTFDETHFKKELFRLAFLARLQDPNGMDKLVCPIHEIASFWHRYFADTRRAVEQLFVDNTDFLDLIPGGVNGFLSIHKNQHIALENFYQEEFKSNPVQVYKLETSDGKMLFLRKIMYSYLRWIYEENGKTVAILRRDWETGRPLKQFIIDTKGDDRLFLVDPLGGLFFTDMLHEKKYYCVQNAVLKSLWDYALISKCDFLKYVCTDHVF